jgi:hypothetical protein
MEVNVFMKELLAKMDDINDTLKSFAGGTHVPPTDVKDKEPAKEEAKPAGKKDPFAGLDVDPDIEYGLADIRKALAKLVDAAGETRAIEVLELFNAKKLSDIDDADYGKFVAFIEKDIE